MNNRKNAYFRMLCDSISTLVEIKDLYVKNPGKDFSRKRKLPMEKLIEILLSIGGNTLNKELLDYFDYDVETATSSAFVQQREKLLPEAMEYLLHEFNSKLSHKELFNGYRLLSVDGSDVNIPKNPLDSETYVQHNADSKGFNLLHLNIMFDLLNKQYLDIEIHKFKKQNEQRAAANMVDRSQLEEDVILILDRGYENYNLIAHIMNKGWKYLIRVKNPNSKTGIIKALKSHQDTEFDKRMEINLSRRQTKALKSDPTHRLLAKSSTFDYLLAGEKGRYSIKFRVVSVEVEKGKFQYFVTNLDKESFSSKTIGELYHLRWGIETSFRDLKYSLGLTSFNSKKINLIKQEIYSKMIMYNYCAAIVVNITLKKLNTKHEYQINFSMAIKICKNTYRKMHSKSPPQLEALIGRYILPIRKNRKYPRKVRFRSCVCFNYRVA